LSEPPALASGSFVVSERDFTELVEVEVPAVGRGRGLTSAVTPAEVNRTREKRTTIRAARIGWPI